MALVILLVFFTFYEAVYGFLFDRDAVALRVVFGLDRLIPTALRYWDADPAFVASDVPISGLCGSSLSDQQSSRTQKCRCWLSY